MPVFLRVCPEGKRTESIFAPSISWNSVIHVTGTFRWFYYPSDDTSLTVLASGSTSVNYKAVVAWERLPTRPGLFTDEAELRLERSIFFRFFGLGPDTPASAETSYTALRAVARGRRGLNVAPHTNVGLTLSLERYIVQDIGVPGLPLSRRVFPDAPGMGGATLLSQAIDLRYDTRRGGDYAERGVRADASVGVVEGLAGSPAFLRGGLQLRGILPEFERVTGAARLWWNAVSSSQAPFYRQSSLGGDQFLRGFTQDRFLAQQAWTVEAEQRIRLLRTQIFGVETDWRIDPFVAAGQVFGAFGEALSHPRAAVGVGFRAFVRPNVLGRIDVAYAGEGMNVYVELGYPF